MEEEASYGAGLRHLWQLESDARFLNHGSYGATPLPVLAAQDHWRQRMESQPVRFMQRELPEALRESAAVLASFLGTAGERLAFVENATAGANAVLRSLEFRPGDVILTTDHVYNAIRQTLRFVTARSGASFIELEVGLPLPDPAEIAARFESALTPAVKLLVIDHLASASAAIMPVAEIVALAKARGIPVLVDGAHTPGMLPLAVDGLGATWFVGNCHKWLMAPKGAGFIVAAADAPPIHPTVISHPYGEGFPAEFDWVGTRDHSAWLAVPAAIAFHDDLGGKRLRIRNHELAIAMGQELAQALGTRLGAAPEQFGSMVTVELPERFGQDRAAAKLLHDRLWDAHQIEVPVMAFAGKLWIRISVQAYNEPDDYAALRLALN